MIHDFNSLNVNETAKKVTAKKTFQNLSPEKQERITRIAVEEFGNKGFDGASINTMVDRMKIAKGSIFQYFGDKKGLFLFVFNSSVAMVKGYLKTVRDQSADQDLPTRLNKTLAAGIHFIKTHPLLYRLYLKVLYDPKAPFRDEILISLRTHSVEYLKSLLENALSKKEINPHIDMNKAAFVLDAVMDRFLQAHTIRHLDSGLGIFEAESHQTQAWINEVSEMICTGIAAADISDVSVSIKKPYILIVAAVSEELSGLNQKIQSPYQSTVGNRSIVSGTLAGVNVKLLCAGPGMVNTAQSLTAVIEYERPQLIVQTGCAGAFRQSGLCLGDVAIATEETDIHSGLESGVDSFFTDELPFALIKTDGHEFKNRYPTDGDLTDRAYQILTAGNFHPEFMVIKGPFITVSTITTTDQRAAGLFERFHACMEQMEGAAAAHIAALYDLPFVQIRSAGNFVGKRDRSSWDLDLAFKNSNAAVFKFIQDLIIDKINH